MCNCCCVCLSVRPSEVGVLSKRLNISSRAKNTAPYPMNAGFLPSKVLVKCQVGSSSRVVTPRGGTYTCRRINMRLSTNNSLYVYLGNDTKVSMEGEQKSYALYPLVHTSPMTHPKLPLFYVLGPALYLWNGWSLSLHILRTGRPYHQVLALWWQITP